ncbi:hypothetical protein [Nostoc sp.]|uniref:hypothetical protein n=1 Tax=Nostoc sp. TaxID=1180 RepID=UPI002FFB0B76
MKKIPDTDKKPILLRVSLLQLASVTTAIVPLQPQEEKIISEPERLIAQVERVNEVAGELEAAILELKAIANTVNTQRRYPLLKKELGNICQYFAVNVPWVKRKADGSFILTTRKVDLFRAEREATLLAQQLRQRTKKRLASQRQRKNKSGSDTKCLFKKVLVNKS